MPALNASLRTQPKRAERLGKKAARNGGPASTVSRRGATQSTRSNGNSGHPALPSQAASPRQWQVPLAPMPPAPPPGSIARPHLVRRLQETHATVIALLAPAGYGKSTLLAEWAQCDPRPFAWVELTRREEDPAQLAGLLARALAALDDGNDAVLVLDRLERLCSAEELAVVTALVHEPPPSLTVALASRGDPPLGLARVRAEGRLLKMGARDLTMSVAEAGRLLAAGGVALDEGALHRLTACTEGWPAVLRLASFSLGEQAGASDPVSEVTGDADGIAEYISEEVLAPLDPDSRALLLRSSVLDELSGEACDATLARHGSGRVLDELAAAGTPLTPLDPAHARWRCHPLLRDVLRRDLAMCDPAEIPRLHRRAGAFFAARGDGERALAHACAARDAKLAGELLWSQVAHLLYGRDEQVKRLLSGLAAHEIESRPPLALAAAHCDVALGDLASAMRWARLAERTPSHDANRASQRAAAQLARISACTGHIEQLASEADSARRSLEQANDPLLGLANMICGVIAHLLGEPASARALLERSLETCSSSSMPVVAAISVAQLVLIDVEDGALELAEDRLTSAEPLSLGLGRRRSAVSTHATSAFVKSRRGLIDEAKEELELAWQLLSLPGELTPWLEVQTRLVMARASIGLADVTRARALLSQASRLARRGEPVPRLLCWIDEAWGEIDELGAAALGGPASLTIAELRILRFLPTHLSFREIGERLHVSGNTVKTQAHAIYAKLDAASRTEAVARASAIGLIDAAVV